MQPMFTIHAGEYIVGSHIEQNLKDKHGKKLNLWVPSKDMGIDLLVTNSDNSKMTSIQVKFSKDFLVTHGKPAYQQKLLSCGWWTLNWQKLNNSYADFWVFVLHTFNQKNMQYVIIEPKNLYNRLKTIHNGVKSLQIYFWVTVSKKCWETRGLKKKEQDDIVSDTYKNQTRDFTDFLNNWNPIINKLI